MKTHLNALERINNARGDGRKSKIALARSLRQFITLITAGLFSVWIFASHAGEATSRVSTIRVPGDCQVMKAQLGADGTIHLLLQTAESETSVL